jgi:hypothetical protein
MEIHVFISFTNKKIRYCFSMFRFLFYVQKKCTSSSTRWSICGRFVAVIVDPMSGYFLHPFVGIMGFLYPPGRFVVVIVDPMSGYFLHPFVGIMGFLYPPGPFVVGLSWLSWTQWVGTSSMHLLVTWAFCVHPVHLWLVCRGYRGPNGWVLPPCICW